MAEPPLSQITRMKSSSLIQSKPLTNLISKSNDNNASSAQNPNCLQHLITVPTDHHSILNPPTPIPGDCVRRQTMLNTRSKTKVISLGSQLRTKSNRIEIDGVDDAL